VSADEIPNKVTAGLTAIQKVRFKNFFQQQQDSWSKCICEEGSTSNMTVRLNKYSF
jgi:hypothetical protein